MNYSKIIKYDTANSHGYSITIWVCGCSNKCENCFNPSLWDYKAGQLISSNTIDIICNNLKLPHINNFVILGGEPLAPLNRQDTFTLCQKIKNRFPNINIIIYSGYTIEELKLKENEIKSFDYLIDGRFKKELKIEKQLRGSSNQRCWKMDFPPKDISQEYFRSN